MGAGIGIGYGGAAGASWYVDHVKATGDKLDSLLGGITGPQKAVGMTTLVCLDSYSVLAAVMAHRKYAAFKAAGGVAKNAWEWAKLGMPKKPM